MSWRRVVAALTQLGCEVYRQTDFAVYLHRGATHVVALRKIDPVTRKRQRELVDILGLSLEEYLTALAGSGPPIDGE